MRVLICSESLSPVFAPYSGASFSNDASQRSHRSNRNTDPATDSSSPPDFGRVSVFSNACHACRPFPIFSCSDARCRLLFAKQCQQCVQPFRYKFLLFAHTRYAEVLGHIVFDPAEFIHNVFADGSYRHRATPLSNPGTFIPLPLNGWICNTSYQ